MHTRGTRTSRRNLAAAIAVVVIATAGVAYRALLSAALTTNPTPRTPEAIARGHALWNQHCALCHGSTGHGDGPAAGNLKQRPDDLSTIAAPPIFPDGVVAYRIANGTEFMPAWRAVLGQAQIWDLVHFIRSLAPQSPN